MYKLLLLLNLILLHFSLSLNRQALDFNYHNQEQLERFLNRIANDYPNNTLKYDIGNSTEGRPLYVLAISFVSPLNYEAFDKYKNIKLIGNIHGDEAVGREILLHLIDYALTPSNDPVFLRLKRILGDTILHILPSLNPDGFERALNSENHEWRENVNNVDLNRNYPDYFEINNVIFQPETLAIISWLGAFKFLLSVSFHGGAEVVSYPYDNKNPLYADNYNPSDDDDVFTHLAYTYASSINQRNTCHPTEHFSNGITNGAQWYPVKGGMQDYNYINGVFELTIELSCQKFPPPELLPFYWEIHRKAIISLLEETQKGLEGKVTYSDGRAVSGAAVYIDNRQHPVYTNKFGKFWRLLRPNSYNLTVKVHQCPETSYSYPITIQSAKMEVAEFRLNCPIY